MPSIIVLEPYQALWPADDPNADFRSQVPSTLASTRCRCLRT
jgi:hypothetical protein